MMQKLEGMYKREESLKQQMTLLTMEFKQLQEDKEVLELMIMHQSNKQARRFEFKKKI